jgi:hypothetical protein
MRRPGCSREECLVAALGQAQNGEVAADPTLDGQLLDLGEEVLGGNARDPPRGVKAITQRAVTGPIPVKKRRR